MNPRELFIDTAAKLCTYKPKMGRLILNHTENINEVQVHLYIGISVTTPKAVTVLFTGGKLRTEDFLHSITVCSV